MQTVILIPTFGRKSRIERLCANLSETSDSYALYFIVEASDHETIQEVERIGASMIINPGPPTYASCINAAFSQTDEPFLFTGADDLRFAPSWLCAARETMTRDAHIGVVGTFDPIHPLWDHSTHSLIRRTYIEDHGGSFDRDTVLFPYRHAYTDHELLGVAKARKRYRFCKDSIVEHLHPGWDQLGRSRSDTETFDETYAKNNVHHLRDVETFVERAQQWIPLVTERTPANKSIRKFIRRNSGLRGNLWRKFQLFKANSLVSQKRFQRAA